MSVSFNGLGEMVATFAASGTITKNYPVVMYSGKTVSEAESGDRFIGFCTDCDLAYASVQLAGHIKTKYTSTAPTVGYTTLAADGDGGVCTSADGTECLILSVDTVSSTVEFLF